LTDEVQVVALEKEEPGDTKTLGKNLMNITHGYTFELAPGK
jgi:hypothetical protein